MSPPDWADREAEAILDRVGSTVLTKELHTWLACKLRLVREEGVGEGVERVAKAITPTLAEFSGGALT